MQIKTKKLLIIVALFVVITAACTFPLVNQAKTDAAMQTEIAQVLTSMGTQSSPVTDQNPVETIASNPTAMLPSMPSATPLSSNVPTIETGQIATSTNTPQVSGTEFVNTPAPLPTENPPTVSVTQSTPTAAPGDPVNTLGNPIWTDTFDSGDSWALGSDQFMNLSASNGTLRMTGLVLQSGWRVSNRQAVNFYLETKGKMENCSGSDNFGLFFRVAPVKYDRGYLLGISCDGKYALRKWDVDTMTTLRNWTANSAIIKGPNQLNRIGVWANGNELKLYVNGILVDTIKDPSFGAGYIGVYIGPRETNKLTGILEEISLWNLP